MGHYWDEIGDGVHDTPFFVPFAILGRDTLLWCFARYCLFNTLIFHIHIAQCTKKLLGLVPHFRYSNGKN